MTTKRKAQGATKGKAVEEVRAFAHHLSEALRIARTSDLITSRFYNDLFDAWNEYANTVIHNSRVWETADYIELILADAERQAEGGAE